MSILVQLIPDLNTLLGNLVIISKHILCVYIYNHNNELGLLKFLFRTCYIAGEYIRMLKRKQPELGITDKDVLHIQIAALCRNLAWYVDIHMQHHIN
jgi:hypothetical protein